jgi:hypothetical protein
VKRVIDTNVPIVANGKSQSVSADCVIAAIEYLERIIERGKIVLDDAGEIQSEYHRHLNVSGMPGVGDRFYQLIIAHGFKKVEKVSLPKDHAGEYIDFPKDAALSGFDRSDRVFAAAANKVKVPVANATDSDWLDFRLPLNSNGIAIDFVCTCDRRTWFTQQDLAI